MESEQTSNNPPQLRPRTWVAIVSAILGAGLVALVLLLWVPGLSEDPAEAANQLDTIKVCLSVVAGLGAGVALWLSFRRQQSTEQDINQKERALSHQIAEAEKSRAHQDRVASNTEKDAAERRITDTYGRSIEHLGSDKAAVRLGGLYALERLANENEPLQQMVCNVICAYLRMPPDCSPDTLKTYLKRKRPKVAEIETDISEQQIAEEIQVRMAAQSILHRHCVESTDFRYNLAPQIWKEMTFDLAGAVLINLDFSDVVLGTISFHGATFVGPAIFNESLFEGYVNFSGARFMDYASFEKSVHEELGSTFSECVFDGTAYFTGAKFAGRGAFDSCKFKSDANFEAVHIDGPGEFYFTKFEAGFDLSTILEIDLQGATASNKDCARSWADPWVLKPKDDTEKILYFSDPRDPSPEC